MVVTKGHTYLLLPPGIKALNINSHETCCMLFAEDRKPITDRNDQRLVYSKSLATMLKSMNTYSASSKTRILGLTTDTSNQLHITLNGIIKLIPFLLTNISHVLTVEFQSDRFKGESGLCDFHSWAEETITFQSSKYWIVLLSNILKGVMSRIVTFFSWLSLQSDIIIASILSQQCN